MATNFKPGFYAVRVGEDTQVRRAVVEGGRVIWYETHFDRFVGVETVSNAISRVLLEEITHLPNYVSPLPPASRSE